MVSSFEKVFPKPILTHQPGWTSSDSVLLVMYNCRRDGYLTALKWAIARRNFYRDERKVVGVDYTRGAASQVIDDIEKEIAAVELEKK